MSLRRAFTLIELLVVIAIIATVAAILIPTVGAIEKKATIQRAQSERDQLETAIQSYYAKYGFYPPSGNNPLINPLYYELLGTTNNSSAGSFTTLDDSSTLSTNTISGVYGIGGFMNCTKGSGEDAITAQDFLPQLKPGQIANSNGVYMIVTAVNSDATYKPLSGVRSLASYPANPWRYIYPGTNNPTSYDLYLQIDVGGTTDLICNWKDQPQYNSSLP